ncbi:MAG: ElyC/SanA/YdcF family protein [Patescibacteria group bacterium]|jgi:vancomycin permeability regulator SanA
MKRKLIVRMVLIVCAIGVGIIFISVAVVRNAARFIVSEDEVAHAPIAIVLGAGVKESGDPSDMLRDRLLTAVDLYHRGVVDKLLLSGDNGQIEYDEVNAMRIFVLAQNVPAEDIFLDHAGFDTYDSMVRAREVFGISSAIIVTQKYHLARALFLGRTEGIDAYGVIADRQRYLGAIRYQFREIFADVKAVLSVVFNVSPTYLGVPIDSTGDGRATWD